MWGEELVSVFNYRKKQQERRGAPLHPLASSGGGEGGRGETDEKGETRIVFALNPATAAPGAALSYNKAARPRDEGEGEEGGKGRREPPGRCYAKIC